MNLETLTVPLQIKAPTDLKPREIAGHGSVFGNVDLGGDVVMRGAFLNSLAEHEADGTMPQMFWQHRPDKVPGKWLDMHEDDTGLAVRGVLAKTELGDEMRTLTKMKAVRGLSIGYYTRDAEWTDDGVRKIIEAGLVETSLVSLAMNPQAQIESAKSQLSAIGEYVPTVREFERILRDAGCSISLAKLLCKTAFNGSPRDAGDPLRDADSEANSEIIEAMDRIVTDNRLASLNI